MQTDLMKIATTCANAPHGSYAKGRVHKAGTMYIVGVKQLTKAARARS